MDRDRLAEIKERLSKTSKGDWSYNTSSCVLRMGRLNDVELGSFKYRIVAPFVQFSMDDIENDFIFIEHSKNDMEFLIDELTRLKKIDNLGYKSKEDITIEIDKMTSEIASLRMRQENADEQTYLKLSYQVSIVQSKIHALWWVLGK